MNNEEYNKFVDIVKEWYSKKVIQKHCVVCKHYDGAKKLDDGSFSVFSECHRRNQVFPYYHSCREFEPKTINEYVSIYIKE